MEKQSSNHGEGNPDAAERFNSAEQKFVNSPQGKEKIKEGPHVTREEEESLLEAENIGRSRAKGESNAPQK